MYTENTDEKDIILDVAKEIHCRKHIELLDKYFGEKLSCHRRGRWQPKNSSGNWFVWMPKIWRGKNVSDKELKSKWINTISEDGTVIKECTKDQKKIDKYPTEKLEAKYIRLVFSFDDKTKIYTFIGAFQCDKRETGDEERVYKRISTRVKLIGNPVNRIELLDENRDSLTEVYTINRPIGAKTGKFGPWKVLNSNDAEREMDLSCLKYSGSEIPKDILWFFEVNELPVDESFEQVLNYQNTDYRAYIKKKSDDGNTKIFWEDKLNKKFNSYFEEVNHYPILMFTRHGKASYRIKFLNSSKKKSKLIEPLDDTHSLEEKEEQARSMDKESLKAAARSRSGNKKTEREVVVKQIVRDPYISEYAKLRAEGVCQLCGEDAPFKDSKGRPYLESHHIIWLANGGEDSIENTVALCPNCHRKMHILMDEDDVKFLKEIIKE